ncbi:MAG: type II/IV secretion system protein [Candidatus Brennerbacteria bacterium]|nr:type II/IV secretion system protein [Candidatus Brennerbacteria bacterium]
MEDKDLIQELVKSNLLTQVAANKVLKEAFLIQKTPEDLLYERRLVDQVELAKVKSRLLNVPFQELKIEDISDEVLKTIPEETSRTYRLMPVSKTKDMLVIGMLRPDDEKAKEALKFIAQQQHISLGIYLVLFSDLEKIWRRYSPYKSEVEAAVKSMSGAGVEGGQKVIGLEEGTKVGEEAPVIKIVASTLRAAVEMKASDIHIEPQRSRLRIRFRIDGDLQEMNSLPLSLHQPIVSRVKVLSDLKLDENRIPQDGRFRAVIYGQDIDFRVATFPTPTGEKAAIRVLDPSVGVKSMDELSLIPWNLEILKSGLQKPYGMIMVTGPTGSGKTTTLYSLLQEVNKEDVNIVSLEDPVEYFIDGLNQSQVRPEIGYDFASGLRQILRQDPDIIMVGEIRDEETAALAVHAALTGHVVLSTLHTNTSIGVIPRLIDLKVRPFLLPSSLSLMIAQRLLSKICQDCKKPSPAPPEVQKIIKEEIEALPAEVKKIIAFKEPFQVYHGSGCAVCKDKGTLDRQAIYEIFKMTRELSDMISRGVSENILAEEAKRQQMVTLRQDGIIKALNGELLIEEVLRETVNEV